MKRLVLIGVAVVALKCVVAAAAGSAGAHASCGATQTASTAEPARAEAIAIDGSLSTGSPNLRREYRQAALAEVEAVANEQAAVRVVVFGASGVGARVIFVGSFVPVSTVYAFNLAARNRLLCLAKRALASAFIGQTRRAGTDVAGAIAEQAAWAQAEVRPHGKVSLLAITDGCEAPAPSGANAHLTDVCGDLRKGRTPAWILSRHRREFSLGDGRGVRLTMEGVGVGKDQSTASTLRAEQLVAFWRLACRRSRWACDIRSAFS